MGERANIRKLKQAVLRFARCESGEGIEYGLVAALITILCIGGMVASGQQLEGTYNGLSNAWGDSLDDLDAADKQNSPTLE